jgi:uncharacterized protein (TIGR03083 family)
MPGGDTGTMEVNELVDALDDQGQLLAKAASGGDLDLGVPTCPGWKLRDLVLHVGQVHRWATTYVAGARTEPLTDDEEKVVFGENPSDERIVEWFRNGHGSLCDALRAAPPNLVCWSFLPAPSPLAFWARRQAHETAMHRGDAEQCFAALSPFEPRFAADGVDELLTGFAARGRKLVSDPPQTMVVESTDTGDRWFVNLGTERVTAERVLSETAAGLAPTDCTVRGTAEDLYLTLWNRLHTSVLETEGDRSVLDGFCDRLHIRWT